MVKEDSVSRHSSIDLFRYSWIHLLPYGWIRLLPAIVKEDSISRQSTIDMFGFTYQLQSYSKGGVSRQSNVNQLNLLTFVY